MKKYINAASNTISLNNLKIDSMVDIWEYMGFTEFNVKYKYAMFPDLYAVLSDNNLIIAPDDDGEDYCVFVDGAKHVNEILYLFGIDTLSEEEVEQLGLTDEENLPEDITQVYPEIKYKEYTCLWDLLYSGYCF